MSRYSKISSKYILSKFHQDTSQGAIYERDWVTIGNVHRLDPGNRVYYGSSNFIFSDSILPVYKRKRKTGKWVGAYTYEDVKDAEDIVNLITINTDSENLSDYAYWGSMVELFRGSVEHIIKTFPGRIRNTNRTLALHCHFPEENGGVEYWMDAPGYILGNPFGLDLHTDSIEVDDETLLRYVALSWQNYVLEDYDNENVISTPITSYTIDRTTYKQFDCEATNFRLCTINMVCKGYSIIVDTYLINGQIYYCYRANDGTYSNDFDVTYYSGLTDPENRNREIIATQTRSNDDVESTTPPLPNNFAICPNSGIIEDYFRNLTGFEWKLLNRRSKPYYKNTFLLPVQLSNGNWKLVRRTYTWPSEGLWIDIESTDYDAFISDMIALCQIYDELWCDSIWRCMVHESVKNFDWSYRREYDDNDAVENIEGGNQMKDVMRLYGIIYDNAKRYVDGISMYNTVTYDGYNNCTSAQISDRNMLQGWDVTSTEHQFYWYMEIRYNENYEFVSLPVLPVNVDDESPKYVSVTCSGGATTKYYIKQSLPTSDVSLNSLFFNPPYGSVSIVQKGANPWITDNVYHKFYTEISSLSIDPPTYDFSLPNRTLNEFPYQLSDNIAYPPYIQVISNDGKKYYKLVNGSAEFLSNNQRFVNGTWFDTMNEDAVTPGTTDILFNRELNLSSNRILKTKGTKESIDMAFALFGFGRYDRNENPNGDYIIEEQYPVFTAKGYDETFYFYEVIDEEEAEGQTVVTVDELPAGPSANSPEYLKITTVIDESSSFDTYYRLNGEYTVAEAIEMLFAHRLTEKKYDDFYSGVPINDVYVGSTHIIVPFLDSNRMYDGGLYFENDGGWMKTGEHSWDYSETIPYLHILQKISDLFSVDTNRNNNGDIYFVADVSDYYAYSDDVPYYLSNYFKLLDKYNSNRFSGWVNVPIEGPIQNGGYSGIDGVTIEDYWHAKHVDEIIPSILFNNPHCGYDKYDMGEKYISYMQRPYTYSVDNYLYDDDYYQNMASQFYFFHKMRSADKSEITANLISYDGNGRVNTSPDNQNVHVEEQSPEYERMNDKYLKITLFDNGAPIDSSDTRYRMHLEYMRNVVMKYVAQVIPSTTILVLENFVTPESTSNDTVEIAIDVYGEGSVYGAGTYLKTTYVTLNAVPAEGYRFRGWRVNGRNAQSTPPTPGTAPSFVGFENTLTIMACENTTFDAMFIPICEIEVGCDVSSECGSPPQT